MNTVFTILVPRNVTKFLTEELLIFEEGPCFMKLVSCPVWVSR